MPRKITDRIQSTYQHMQIVAPPVVDHDVVNKKYADKAGSKTIEYVVNAPNDPVIDSQQAIFYIPAVMDGYRLIEAVACVFNSSNDIPVTVDPGIWGGGDFLTNGYITIDAYAYNSYTSASPPIIDPNNNTVHTGDQIYLDVGYAAGNGATGLVVMLTFAPGVP